MKIAIITPISIFTEQSIAELRYKYSKKELGVFRIFYSLAIKGESESSNVQDIYYVACKLTDNHIDFTIE